MCLGRWGSLEAKCICKSSYAPEYSFFVNSNKTFFNSPGHEIDPNSITRQSFGQDISQKLRRSENKS